jgi:hypothetical protein
MSDNYDTDELDLIDEDAPDSEDWDEVTLDEAEEVLAEMSDEEAPAEESGEVQITKAERKHREYKLGKKIREAGFTDEQVAAQKASDTIPDEEFGEGEGFITLQAMYQHYKDTYNVTVGEFLELVGGDRGMFPPAIPQLKFRWHGRIRYFAFSDPEEDPEVVATIVNFHDTRQAEKEAKRAAKKAAKEAAETIAAQVEDYTPEVLNALKRGTLIKLVNQQEINTENEELFPAGFQKATKAQLVEALVRANS